MIHPVSRRSSRGYATGLLLSVIAVSGLSLYASAQRQALNAKQAWVEKNSSALQAQAVSIQSAVLQCAELYPYGDNQSPISHPNGKRFPATTADMSAAECPGAPEGSRLIASGRHGVFLPAAGVDFGGWALINDAGGIRLQLILVSPRAHGAAQAAARSLGPGAYFGGGQMAFSISLNPAPPPPLPPGQSIESGAELVDPETSIGMPGGLQDNNESH